MGAFLEKPRTDKHSDNGMGIGLRYGLSSMQGWRVEMEDAHCAVLGLPGLDDWAFFAVFDGHAGFKVSQFCSDNLLDSITATEEFKAHKNAGPGGEAKAKEIAAENIKKAIVTGFLALDDRMREMPEIVSGEDRSGSTAVTVMLSPEKIYFGNCGDSRGVLCKSQKVEFSTQDHKPINPKEKERIQNAGGSVMIQRVNGSLAVSRALGDFEYKNVEGKGPCEQLVSPEPEIFEFPRDKEDEFIVLACDGIWDVMTNEEVVAFVRDRMQVTDDLKSICDMVVDTCLYKGSRDNMSVVIIAFEGAPKVTEEAVQKDKDLDKKIEEKIKEILEQSEVTANVAILPYVLHMLSAEDMEDLPPGAGLCCKKNLIDEVVKRERPSIDENSDSD